MVKVLGCCDMEGSRTDDQPAIQRPISKIQWKKRYLAAVDDGFIDLTGRHVSVFEMAMTSCHKKTCEQDRT